MSREIIFRPNSLHDLAEIWDYSASEWGVSQADAYVREIYSTVAKVAINPALGSPQDHVQRGLRKMGAASHAIYYFHDDRSVRVSRILHGSRDAGAAL